MRGRWFSRLATAENRVSEIGRRGSAVVAPLAAKRHGRVERQHEFRGINEAVSGGHDGMAEVRGTKPVNDGSCRDGQRILLTGATGYLGAFLVGELAATTGCVINCLVRAPDENQGRQRLLANLEQYQRWDEAMADRVTVTRGDLALPYLGLNEGDFTRLADMTDVIFHNGALVNYLFPHARMRKVNVDGTLTLIRLATMSASPKPFHYVSVSGQNPMSPYGRSKIEAEEMVRGSGLPALVYRISRLAPDSRTGLPNSNDILTRLIDIITQVGFAPDIQFSEDWVAVDVAAAAIVAAAMGSCPGRVFELTPSEHTSFGYLLEVGRAHGFRIETEPLPDWVGRVRALASPVHELTIRALRLDDAPDRFGVDPGPDAGTAAADTGQRSVLPASVLEVPGVDRVVLDRFFARRRLAGPAAR